MLDISISVVFKPSGQGAAQCASDPAYPFGRTLDLCDGRRGVWVDLPYPAPECGAWLIEGPMVGKIMVTAAGRADDPKLIKIPLLSGVT